MEYKFTPGTNEINDWVKGIHGKFDGKVVVEVDNEVIGDILNFAVRCAMGGTSETVIKTDGKNCEGEKMIDTNDINLINKLCSKTYTEDDVYTFNIILCNNDIDKDGECFSDDALDKLAEMFIGVTGTYEYDTTAKHQIPRIYDCKSEYVAGKITKYGKPYKHIVAKAFVPINNKSIKLISIFECGIKKEVSIGCGIAKCTCSICGEDMRIGACNHRKGEYYDGKLCFGVLSNPTDVYEWSFRDKSDESKEMIMPIDWNSDNKENKKSRLKE